MEQHNNDVDINVDQEVYSCLDYTSPKSFFLFAGAGSGKTRTLVNVLKKANDSYGRDFKLRNKKIAVITYTNAAANEIIQRLEHSSIFHVSTIHSFSWDLIQNFDQDIKIWIQNNLNTEIAALEKEQSKSRNLRNKTSIGRARKIESKKERLTALEGIRKFVYNPNGNNITNGSLNHSEVISITADFIKSKDLFQKIFVNKFPIVLIDESQDTKKELIDALFELQPNFPSELSLGLIGDMMQRIYADGKEGLGNERLEGWKVFKKKMNHRSQRRIVELNNNIIIRSNIDGQKQYWRTDKGQGVVRFFAVNRNSDKNQTEELIREKMGHETGDTNWTGVEQDIKTLTLEHHMAARRMGFSNFFYPLYSNDKLKTGILDGTLSSVRLFTKVILPIYNAYKSKNKFELANIIKEHSPLIAKEVIQESVEKRKPIRDTNDKVLRFLQLWSNDKHPTLIEILEELNTSKLFYLPNDFKIILDRVASESEDEDAENDDEVLLAWEEALRSSFDEIIKYNQYISDESKFGTHQGVKGLEFDRVMVVIDDDESRGFMFSYDKLFGIKPLTPIDQRHLREGKETGVDRTSRLFYVACSRAKESLAIVAYTDEPETLKNNLVAYNWFSEVEVEVIN